MASGAFAAAPMRSIARAYTRERYGRPAPEAGDADDEAERQAERDYRRVRDQLRRRITARVWHLGQARDEGLARRYATARVAGR